MMVDAMYDHTSVFTLCTIPRLSPGPARHNTRIQVYDYLRKRNTINIYLRTMYYVVYVVQLYCTR